MARPVGMFSQRQGDVRGAVKDCAAFRLDQAQGLARIEMVLQDHSAAVAEHCEQGIDAAEGPEQRNGEPHPVIGAKMHAFADLPHVIDQAPMLQGHALGPGRRARGIENASDVIGFGDAPNVIWRGLAQESQIAKRRGPIRHPVTQHDQTGQGGQANRAHFPQFRQDVTVAEPVRHDQRGDGAMVQLIGLLGRGQPGIEGDRGSAQAQNGEIAGQPFRPVAH